MSFTYITSKLDTNIHKQRYMYVHSKNTRVKCDPEKGPLGPNSIPGQQ